MEANLHIDVAGLDAPHRRALEEVIGQQLQANQRLVIQIMEVEAGAGNQPTPPQSLDEWTNVYDGLSDEEIESVDQIAKTRADLTRHLP